MDNEINALSIVLKEFGYDSSIINGGVVFQCKSKIHDELCVLAENMFKVGQLFPDFKLYTREKYKYTRTVLFLYQKNDTGLKDLTEGRIELPQQTNENIRRILDDYSFDSIIIKENQIESGFASDCVDALYTVVKELFEIGQHFPCLNIKIIKVNPEKKHSDRTMIFY